MRHRISTGADTSQGDINSSIYSHRDECVRRRDDERVKRYNGRVGVILERPDHLHLVPPARRTVSDA